MKFLRGFDAGGQKIFGANLVVVRARDFRVRRRDSRLRLRDDRVLQIPRGIEIGQRGLLNGNGGLGLRQRGAIIAVVQLEQQIARVNLLVVGHGKLRNETGDFRRDHRHVAADIGVVRAFDETSDRPPVVGEFGDADSGEGDQRDERRALERRPAAFLRRGKSASPFNSKRFA